MKTPRTPDIHAHRRGLGYSIVDTFNSKQQSISEKIKEIFEGEDVQTEYKFPGLDYKIDMYFNEYNITVEIDKYDHCDRDIEYEKERIAIKKWFVIL